MNKYESRNCHYFIGALLSILISNIFAVYLQFDNSKQSVLLVQWRSSGTVVLMIFEFSNGKRDKISIT